MKPGDRYTVPLCTACHAKQHRVGELTFWSALRIDPLNVALRLWTVSADVETGELTVFRARQQIIWRRHKGDRRTRRPEQISTTSDASGCEAPQSDLQFSRQRHDHRYLTSALGAALIGCICEARIARRGPSKSRNRTSRTSISALSIPTIWRAPYSFEPGLLDRLDLFSNH
jgi:hypothetical protein